MSVSFVNREAGPWTAVYGLARSLLATATALTLVCNRNDVLFSKDIYFLPEHISAAFIARLNLFTIVPYDWIGLVKWIAILMLLLVASGWRPRLTAIPHWWISWSFAGACSFPDGGEHVTTVLTGLLLPVALTDPRKWHWTPCPVLDSRYARSNEVRRFLARSALTVVRLQVAIIYFHAATAKVSVPEWSNGTVMHYWLRDPVFGAPESLRTILDPITASAVGVMTLTWSAILLEFTLLMGLFMFRPWRFYLYIVGVCFHLMIVVFHGLPSFSIAMTGALTLYLLTPEGLAKLRELPRHLRGSCFRNIRDKGAHHVDSSEAFGVVSINCSSDAIHFPHGELRQRGGTNTAE